MAADDEEVFEYVPFLETNVHEVEDSTGDWMLDSGASRHMTHLRKIRVLSHLRSYCKWLEVMEWRKT